MAVKVDIFNPQKSVIAHGLDGKTILIYGSNGTGKTYNAVRAKKPYVMACESGLNGQVGVAYNKINNWAEFKTVVKQFTDPKTVDQAKELYNTIIIDEVYASAMYCQDFICQTYGNGAIDLGDDTGNTKLNLYRLYEKEYWREVNKLVGSGYTIIFIAHEEADKDGYITPKGDKKRCLAPIIDNCDIVAYIHGNGVDENGKEIKSSAYFTRTQYFFARSRYSHMVPMIKEFTIENLANAIDKAIADEAAESGVASVSFSEQQEQNTSQELSFDELYAQLGELSNKLSDLGFIDETYEILERNLGKGKTPKDLKKGQEQVMSIMVDEFSDLLASVTK